MAGIENNPLKIHAEAIKSRARRAVGREDEEEEDETNIRVKKMISYL